MCALGQGYKSDNNAGLSNFLYDHNQMHTSRNLPKIVKCLLDPSLQSGNILTIVDQVIALVPVGWH